MQSRVPAHLAIIMDGNGRWAKQRMKNRIFGHKQGIKTVKNIAGHCADKGIRHLTLFAFSSENWNRPRIEVKALMSLLKEYLKKEIPWLKEKGIRFRMIGDKQKLPVEVLKVVREAEQKTSMSDKMILNLALSYGGRDEIRRAALKMAQYINEHAIGHNEVTEELFSEFMDTAGQPDPDLLIRTSGEFRISNFLLWQTAYTEFYFTNTLWPDFTTEELDTALINYAQRERRFGKV